MSIDIETLKKEREVLKKDFDLLSSRINQTEKEIGTMKSNLNAVFGAIQQIDKFIKMENTNTGEKQLLNEEEKMSVEKAAALNIATG